VTQAAGIAHDFGGDHRGRLQAGVRRAFIACGPVVTSSTVWRVVHRWGARAEPCRLVHGRVKQRVP
jgi:hypothetical protein